MLAGGLDGGYRGLLATAFDFYVRLEVWEGGVRVDTFGSKGLPKLDGTLSATLNNAVSRTLDFTVDFSFSPDDINDPGYLLSPLNKEIRAFATYNNFYEFQIFRGRIQTVSDESSSLSVSVGCADLAQDVLDDDFTAPRNSVTTFLVNEMYASLVQETLPGANFSGFDTFHELMPKLTWSDSRGAACDDCAKAGSAYWYALANGDFTLKIVPWTKSDLPLVTLINGVGGVLATYSISADRADVYNRISLVGERADGTTPVHAVVEDSNPASPTYINGPFGHRTSTVQIQSATSQGQALGLGNQYLQSSKSFKQTWAATFPPDASMELGDAQLLQDRRGRQSTQVLASFSMPLKTGLMAAQYRAQVPGAVVDAS